MTGPAPARPPRAAEPTGVLLLDASGAAAGAVVAAAAAAGVDVHAVTTPGERAAYPPQLTGRLAGRLLTDLTRPDRALDDVVGYARRHRVGGVLTVNEFLTPLAARAAAALDVPGNDPTLADAARDKAVMAARLTGRGVPVPTTWVLRDHHELEELVASGRAGLPLVTKPARGAGSAGVTIVTSPAQIAAAWDAAASQTAAAWPALTEARGAPGVRRMVVQDLVPGAEYSVESIAQHGRITHLCVTRKTTTGGAHRVELGHSLPAVLPPAVRARVLAEADNAIRAVGIRNGASHTELIVGDGGRPVVLEVGARIGAGSIGDLIQHARGIDLWRALLDVALGRPADLAPTRNRHAAVRFITAPGAGTLTAITGLPHGEPDVRDVRVRAAVGDQVEPAVSNRGRLGSFVVIGDDPQRVDERVDALARGIHVAVTVAGTAAGRAGLAGQVSADTTAAIS